MKKLFLLFAMAVLGLTTATAQSNFGLTGGLLVGSANASIGGYDFDELADALDMRDGAGFYVGLLGNFMATEKLYVQPEVLYANIGGDGAIIVPLVAKYYIAEQFNIQAGPQFDFLLDVPNIQDVAIKKSGVSIAFGAGFDLNEKFAIQAKYSIGMTDYIDSDISDLIPDGIIGDLLNPDIKINALQVGLVYKFN